MKKRFLDDALTLKLARLARALVKSLPLGASLFLGRSVAGTLHAFSSRRRVSYQNLRFAFAGEGKSPAEIKRIARRAAENLGMSVVEILRFPDTDLAYVEKNIAIVGEEKLKPHLEKGKGVIFITGHFGNWEFLNITGNLKGFPIVALARAQKQAASDAYLNELRTSKGAQVIRKGMPLREILRALHAGKIVGMVVDQDGGKAGIFVDFFGRLSSTPQGAAAFGLKTGAPVVPIFIFREGKTNRHRIEIEDALKTPDASVPEADAERFMLQQFADVLESKIRKSPEQWLWAHRRWKSSPDRWVVTLSDGRAGHLNQSLAVVDALRRERQARGVAPERLHEKTIEVRFRSKFARTALTLAASAFAGRPPLRGALVRWALAPESYSEILRSHADWTVATGSSLAAVNLFMAELCVAKPIQVMRPPFSPKRFKAVIVPRHDRPKPAANVFVTECAPSRMDRPTLERAGKGLAEAVGLNGRPRLGLLVGGDTDRVRFREDLFGRVLDEISAYSRETGAQVLATSSRRTPSWADAAMKKAFADRGRCPFLVIANESNPPGTVAGILGASDTVVVSGESMSMVSEAVLSGKRVVVFTPDASPNLKPKYRAFLERLSSEKRIALAEPGKLADALRSLERAQAAPPADAEVLRAAVQAVL